MKPFFPKRLFLARLSDPCCLRGAVYCEKLWSMSLGYCKPCRSIGACPLLPHAKQWLLLFLEMQYVFFLLKTCLSWLQWCHSHRLSLYWCWSGFASWGCVASALAKDQPALQLCVRDSQGDCPLQAVVFLQQGVVEVRWKWLWGVLRPPPQNFMSG